YLLVRVFALGVECPHDVRVVRVEVHRARALALPQLVRVGEAVFQNLHDGNHPAAGVRDVLNRCRGFPQVGQVDSHPAASLRELQGRVDSAPDGFHVVLHAQQEAANALPALRPTGVQESRGGGLEVAADNSVHEVAGEVVVTVGQVDGAHDDAVLV